jgi:hypothetical protein
MTRWQYAWLTDQPATTIGFSHPQPGLAAELAGVLGPGLILQQSTEWSLSLDRMRVNLGYVSGLLGDRGWEMFSVETRLQPGAMSPAQLQTSWYFKRQAPDAPATQQPMTAPMAAPTPPPTGPTGPTPGQAYAPASTVSPSDTTGVGFAAVNPSPTAAPEPPSGAGFPPPPGPGQG